jgi:hypothetical protein
MAARAAEEVSVQLLQLKYPIESLLASSVYTHGGHKRLKSRSAVQLRHTTN